MLLVTQESIGLFIGWLYVVNNGIILCFARYNGLTCNIEYSYNFPISFTQAEPACIGCYNHNAHTCVLRVWCNSTRIKLIPDQWSNIYQTGGRSYLVIGY